jgi:hypothetical protein
LPHLHNNRRFTDWLRRLRWALTLLVCCSAWGYPGSAHSEPAGEIVVAEFQGSKSKSLRQLVVDLLRAEGYSLVADGAAPTVNPAGDNEHFISLAKQGQLRAFVLGSTELDTKTWATTITVREGKTGKVLSSAVIESGWYPGLQKALKQRLVSHISGALGSAEAPEKEDAKPVAPVVAAEPSPQKDPAKEPPPAPAKAEPAPVKAREDAALDKGPTYQKPKDRLNALEIDLGPLFTQRAWVISDPLPGAVDGPLSPNHDATMLGLQLGATFYPAGFSTKSFWRNIGLQLNYQRTFYGQTPILGAEGEESRDTTLQEIAGALRVRIPLGSLQLGVLAGFGLHSLTLAGEKVIAALPDTNYRFYRAGGDVRFEMTRDLSAKLGLAFRGVLNVGDDAGQVQGPEWFPGTKAVGLDGTLNVDYAFSKVWGLRLGGLLTRYVMAFDPDPAAIGAAASSGDPAPPIAGGASDMYVGGYLSALVTLQ